jgi:hypothetical protein
VLNYYIYYRVNPHFEAEAAAAARQIQFELEAETGIEGRLLRKRGEPQLWMEVYEGVAAGDAFEITLGKAVEKAGFARFLPEGATRKTECFQG